LKQALKDSKCKGKGNSKGKTSLSWEKAREKRKQAKTDWDKEQADLWKAELEAWKDWDEEPKKKKKKKAKDDQPGDAQDAETLTSSDGKLKRKAGDSQDAETMIPNDGKLRSKKKKTAKEADDWAGEEEWEEK